MPWEFLGTNDTLVVALVNYGGQLPMGPALDMSSAVFNPFTHTTTSQPPLPTSVPTEDSVLDQVIEDIGLSFTQCLCKTQCRKVWLVEKWASWTGKLTGWYSATYRSFSKNDDDDDDEKLREIPQFVFDYAPYCWLYSYEDYWPSLMQTHIEHTTPYLDFIKLDEDVDVDNLDKLNKYDYHHTFLTSNEDPEGYPDFMGSMDNIPDDSGYSKAPAILIVVDKGAYVDAFWFFWYSFNLGNQVLGVRFGNHIGDWEHTMMRFHKRTGKPTQIFFSEHEWGAGYEWQDCEQEGDRVRLFPSSFATSNTNPPSSTLIQHTARMPCTEPQVHILTGPPVTY
jgi:hypothetical protein